MKRRNPSDLVERERLAQRDGVKRPAMRRLQSAPGATVSASIELALVGDYSRLAERLRAGCASQEELSLAADILTEKIKPQRKAHKHLITEDRRQNVVEFIRNGERENPGIKRESLIEEATKRFNITRSEVFTSLKLFESK